MGDRSTASRILIISNTAFLPAIEGDSRRLYGLITGLRAQGMVVGIVHLHDDEQRHADYSAMRTHCDFLEVHYSTEHEIGSRSRGLDSWCSEPFLSKVRNSVDSFSPDAVIAQFAYMSKCLSEIKHVQAILRILDADNIFHLRQARFASVNIDENWVRATVEEEVAAWSRADIVLSIQREECREISKHVPDTPVLLLYPTTPSLRLNISNFRTLLFVGSNNAANVSGLKRFAADVLPIVEAAIVGVRLEVVGSVCDAFPVPVSDAIRFHGVQPDLVGYYQRAAIALNLVEASSGINMKLVEALGFGRCVISTPGGAHALRGLTGAVVIARPGAAMASEIIDLLSDARRLARLSDMAFAFSSKNFSDTATISRLTEVIHQWKQNRNRDALKRFLSAT